MCPLANALYWASLNVFEQTLSKSSVRDSFFVKRDNNLEEETLKVFQALFGQEATYLLGVYETEDLQHEHDLILKWKKKLLIIESKASPPQEPFRDPGKAFVRIKRDFKSDSGIQKGYEQGNRIRRKLINEKQEVTLFNGDRNVETILKPDDFEEIFCVVVTRDNYGMLSSDLSLLLEKNDEDSYPWAVNILDLQNISNVWRHFGFGTEKLLKYLSDRIRINGKAITDDELDIVGYFIRHEGFDKIINEDAVFHLNPNYSDIFDEVYKAEISGEEYSFSTTEPVTHSMSDIMSDVFNDSPKLENKPSEPIRFDNVGRNDKCPCGSGKKYKYCCLRK